MDIELLEQRQSDLLARIDQGVPATEIEAVEAEVEEVRKAIEDHNTSVAKAAEMRARISGSTLTRPEVKTVSVKAEEKAETRSIAEQFVQSSSVAEYRQSGVGKRQSAGINLEGVEMRALITTTTGAVLTPNQRIPGMVNVTEDRTLRLADIIPTIPVSGNAIEYVRDNSSVPIGAAAEVAEGSAKPEATYTWELITDTVKTIAHWTDITRQALDDEVQLRGLVQARLFYGLRYRVDAQILNGTGSGANIKGLLATGTGILAYAPSAAEARVVSLRKAKTMTQVNEFIADTVVLNPNDWETLELTTDNNSAWKVTQDPQGILSGRIWGMNVVETSAIAAGTALVGDFRQAVQLYDRQQASLYVTDSDADKFRSNILTLLAELRVGLGIVRPKALVKVTFNGSV